MTKEDALFFLGRFRTKGINENLYDALGVAIEVLNAQTDTPERKRGKWIPHNEEKEFGWGMRAKGGVECSVCGYKTYNKMHRLFGCSFYYCPMCGTEMQNNV